MSFGKLNLFHFQCASLEIDINLFQHCIIFQVFKWMGIGIP